MNNSNHSIETPSQDPLGRSTLLVAIETFFAIMVTMTSFLGNSLVIYVIHKFSSLKSITNVFVENLAWTDICMSSSHMPFWVLSIYYGRWVVDEGFCPWAASMQLVFGVCSILTMGLIAINRYFKVVRPSLYTKIFGSFRSAVMCCVLIWIISILLSTPPLYGWGVFAYHNKFALCSVVWEMKHISYVIMICGCSVNGVTVVIFICYYRIYKKVKSSTANINEHQQNSTSMHSTDIKLLKSTFAVVCFFLATWTPVTCMVIVDTAGGRPPRSLYAAVIYLMFTSSLGNPIIYGILNPKFRKAFLSVLRCCKDSEDVSINSVGVTQITRTDHEVVSVYKNDN